MCLRDIYFGVVIGFLNFCMPSYFPHTLHPPHCALELNDVTIQAYYRRHIFYNTKNGFRRLCMDCKWKCSVLVRINYIKDSFFSSFLQLVNSGVKFLGSPVRYLSKVVLLQNYQLCIVILLGFISNPRRG